MMTMTKKLGLAASLAMASTFVMADNTHNLDVYATTHASGTTISYAATFDTGVAGSFTDTLTFTVPNTSPLWDFDASIQAVSSSVSEFTDISLNGVVGTTGYTLGGIFSTAKYGELETTNGIYTALAPGTYSLILNGLAANTSSEYNVSAVLSVSPVPEPSAIALMLGGLGLVGFMAARRKKA